MVNTLRRGSGPGDRSRAGSPGSQGFQGGGLAGAGEAVAAVGPPGADRQQAEGAAQVASGMDGPADAVFVGRLTGPAVPEPLFGSGQADGGVDLAAGDLLGVQQQGEE